LSHEFLGEFSNTTQDHTPTIPGIWEPTPRAFGVVPKAGRTEKKSHDLLVTPCAWTTAGIARLDDAAWTTRRMRVWYLKMGTVVINPRFGGFKF